MSIADDLKKPLIEEQEHPVCGKLRVRHLTGRELDELLTQGQDALEQLRRMVAISVVDEHDQPVFASPDDLLDLARKKVEALSDVVIGINGLRKEVEAKNSEAPPSAG